MTAAATGVSLLGCGLAATFPVVLGFVGDRYAQLAGTAFSVVIVMALRKSCSIWPTPRGACTSASSRRTTCPEAPPRTTGCTRRSSSTSGASRGCR
jgi:hypothetical protein